MAVTVIIVSYNSSPLLVECVQSVLASALPVRVIVSDNGSTDCSVEPLEDLAAADSRLRVLRNGCNLGFAGGNNVALPWAEGDYVLFLNPDCILRPDTLARMVAALDAHPKAAMAGCLIHNPDGSEQAGCRRLMPTPRRLLASLGGRAPLAAAEGPLPAAPTAVEAISGAFMLVRRQALAEVGSFDEGYFMHWEDLDLCQRLRQAGHEILFVPDVEILHFKGRSSRRRPWRVEWHKHAGLVRFLAKFHFRSWRRPLLAPLALAVGLRFLAKAVLALRSRTAEPVGDTTIAADGGPEVWVFGATSLVGRCLLPRLLAAGYRVRAFCTDPARAGAGGSPRLTFHGHDIRDVSAMPPGKPQALIHLAPLPLLPPWIEPLARRGVRQVIAFGSTSRYSKADSSLPDERSLAASLARAEESVMADCARLGVAWAIFRPTLIYCLGHDRNISLLAAFIRRFGFLPLPGEGRGLRQPVHADDLAKACLTLLASRDGWNRAYNLSGGETLSYRDMVEALFRRLGRRPRILTLPAGLLRLLVAGLRLLPAYRRINPAMIDRINADLCFDHEEARRGFGFAPRPFQP